MTPPNVVMLSDLELLGKLAGEKTAARCYRGSTNQLIER